MEPARTERVGNQAEDRVPASGTTSRRNHKNTADSAAVEAPARVKAAVAVVDRDKVAAREAVGVKTVDTGTNHTFF